MLLDRHSICQPHDLCEIQNLCDFLWLHPTGNPAGGFILLQHMFGMWQHMLCICQSYDIFTKKQKTGICQAYSCYIKTCLICQSYAIHMPVIWRTLSYDWHMTGICLEYSTSGDSRCNQLLRGIGVWFFIRTACHSGCSSTRMSCTSGCGFRFTPSCTWGPIQRSSRASLTTTACHQCWCAAEPTSCWDRTQTS